MSSTERNVSLAISLDKIGDSARRRGDYPAAKSAYDRALPIFRSVVSQNSEYLRDLSLCLSKYGELHLDQADIESATPYLEEHCTIAARLAHSKPGDGTLQQDLAGAYGRFQRLATAKRDFASALKYARAALEIMEKLHSRDPKHTNWRQDLSGAHYMVGALHMETGNREEALREFDQSSSIAADLAKESLLDAKGRTLLLGLASQYDQLNQPAKAAVSVSLGLLFCDSPTNEEHLDAFPNLERLALMVADKLLDYAGSAVLVSTICDLLADRYAKGFGADDMNRLLYHNIHGILLKRLGDLKNAEVHYRKSYEASYRHLGSNHPGTQASKRNLDWIINAQRQG